MKKTFLIISLFFVQLAQAAIDEKLTFSAPMVEFQVQHLRLAGVNRGEVILDKSRNKIKLELTQVINCEPNMLCAAVEPLLHTIELPIVNSYKGRCGEEIYVAEVDQRPADGLYQNIELIDYSNLTCRYLPENPTMVTYKTIQPFSVDDDAVVSHFTAEVLSEMMILNAY